MILKYKIISLFSTIDYMATTATLENVNKFSKIGLRRRPTYQEIIGLIDENEKIAGKLPNRDATFFRNSNEVEQMEALKDEQARLLLRQMGDVLLRQNMRTAGKTFHAERSKQMPLQSPSIITPEPMNVDAEGGEQPAPPARGAGQSPPTQVPLSTRLQQASQLGAELAQRIQTSMKRKEETAMNHRGEVFKQTKPSIIEETMMPPLTKPRSFAPIKPESFNIATDDEVMPQAKAKPQTKPKAKASASSSSSQAMPVIEVMDVSSTNKRGANPETTVEPRGKAGRSKHFKEGTERKNADKRDGSSPEEEPKMRKKRTLRQKPREAFATKKKTELEIGGAEADDEIDEPKENRRKTIQKPIGASTIGVQRLREEFVIAKNKDMITKEQYEQFDSAYKTWFASKGNDGKKKQMLKQMREVYKLHLWQKLKDMYKAQ